jgi:hypothetical protein
MTTNFNAPPGGTGRAQNDHQAGQQGNPAYASKTGAAQSFTVTNARLIHKNSLVGCFDLQMPSGLVVRGVMLLESNGRRWINFPSKEWTKPDGSRGFSPLLEFASREIADRFQRQVLPLAEQAFEAAP